MWGLPFQDRAFVMLRPWRRIGEIRAFGKVLGEVARDIVQGFELRFLFRLEDHFLASFFDQDFVALEAKGFGKPDGLAPAVLEDFGCHCAYRM